MIDNKVIYKLLMSDIKEDWQMGLIFFFKKFKDKILERPIIKGVRILYSDDISDLLQEPVKFTMRWRENFNFETYEGDDY